LKCKVVQEKSLKIKALKVGVIFLLVRFQVFEQLV